VRVGADVGVSGVMMVTDPGCSLLWLCTDTSSGEPQPGHCRIDFQWDYRSAFRPR
jgi:hypothetical protein